VSWVEVPAEIEAVQRQSAQEGSTFFSTTQVASKNFTSKRSSTTYSRAAN
jgi:hypothetical protein